MCRFPVGSAIGSSPMSGAFLSLSFFLSPPSAAQSSLIGQPFHILARYTGI